MRALVLHSHPLEESYSAALRDRVEKALIEAGHEVDLVKLGPGDEPGPPAEALREVEILVLVHPTWWGGQPAPLLDWIQRVLGPWIDGRAETGPSPLARVRHVAAVTTHGSSRLVNRLQGEPGRRLLERCVVPLGADRARFHWLALYKLDQRDRGELEAFIEQAGRMIGRLTSARTSA